MKYVVLIHSHPEPWSHPTLENTDEGRALPAEERRRFGADFDALLAELTASGEFVTAEALAEPAAARILRWGSGGPLVTDGPFAETKEQLAGFFVIECATPARAQDVARRFAAPGDTIELRPTASD